MNEPNFPPISEPMVRPKERKWNPADSLSALVELQKKEIARLLQIEDAHKHLLEACRKMVQNKSEMHLHNKYNTGAFDNAWDMIALVVKLADESKAEKSSDDA